MPNKRSTINKQPSTELISDEIKFLITCCQTNPSENDINSIRSFIKNSEFNIKNSLALANAHGILPLVYKTIKELSQADSSFLNA